MQTNPWWLALALTAASCSFFEELQDAESAGTDGTGDSGGASTGAVDTEAAVCDLLEDDTCVDQDLVRSCDPSTGVLTEANCLLECGGFLNFTCLGLPTGQHACWCVEPGAQKVIACRGLEDCLRDCQGAADTRCADACFIKTTQSTIRLYGALVHCANGGCEALCKEDPVQCGPCIELGMAGGGECALERAVCDDDRNDDPFP